MLIQNNDLYLQKLQILPPFLADWIVSPSPCATKYYCETAATVILKVDVVSKTVLVPFKV